MIARKPHELRDFYESQLFGHILPFWMKYGIDRESGGFFTCFSNRGDKLLHAHKFTWSQGRFVWVLSRLARAWRGRRPADEIEQYTQAARGGAEFLMKHARLPNGNCASILSREGRPILLNPDGTPRQAGPGEVYDTSAYATGFVAYGLAEYALAANDAAAYEFARQLYKAVVHEFHKPRYRSDPWPVPPGFRAHGPPMILCLDVLDRPACRAVGD